MLHVLGKALRINQGLKYTLFVFMASVVTGMNLINVNKYEIAIVVSTMDASHMVLGEWKLIICLCSFYYL